MKLLDLSVYDESGRITSFMTVPDSMVNLQTDNVMFGRSDPATEYVLDRTIVPRPVCPATLSGTVLSTMPAPCTLFINAVPYEVDEDTVTLTFPRAGTYRLRVVAWPHLDGNFVIEQ